MKIICAGYWKTGTKSLAQALKILGYKVYDYDDQYFELGDLWDKFFNGTVTDEEIYSSLKDIDVLIDGPTMAFWEEIYKVFPDAKVILTTRDEDSWYKSYQNMCDSNTTKLKFQIMMSLLLPAGYKFNRTLNGVLRFCNGIEPLYPIRPRPNPRLFKLKYRKHNSYVLHRVAKNKLLVYESKYGWSPLCKFLGRDNIPAQDYPHKNKAGSVIFYAEKRNPKLEKLMKQSEYLMYSVIIILVVAMYHALNCLFC